MKHLKLKKVVLIGASTGGPGQINKIIKSLPALRSTSIVIAQHMSDGFLESFMDRLKQLSSSNIELTKNNKILNVNTIYVCENSTSLIKNQNDLIFIENKKIKNSFNPDINLIFNSFITLCDEVKVLSVILTGIGDDGVQACVNLSNNSARCITETSSSAIIDGMPNRARELVPNIEVYDMQKIIKVISEFCE